jgi:hypothetical protein
VWLHGGGVTVNVGNSQYIWETAVVLFSINMPAGCMLVAKPMLRRSLVWAVVVCLTLAVAGYYLGYYLGYLQASSKQSMQLLPATKILRSAVSASSPSGKPLPSPQTLFEAADSALTAMERLDIRLDIYQSLSPLFVAMVATFSRGSGQLGAISQTTSTSPFVIDDFYDINVFIQNEWHIDFRNKLILYSRIQDNTTYRVPQNLRGIMNSSSILKAAYDGHRWVIIHDENFYHPNYLPERDWQYHVVLLRSLEEGRRAGVDGAPSTEYLLPLFGLHRAYLFAGNNMRSLLDIDKLAFISDVPEGWVLQTQGVEQIGRYQCYRVKATDQRTRSEVWLWFCPSLQYRCIRAEAISGGTRESSRFVIVAEIPEWVTQGSPVPLPKRLQIARYISSSPLSSEYALLDKSEIVVHYLPPVEDSAYRLSIPAESAYVSDNIANRVYTLGKQVPIAPRRFPWWLLGVLVGFLLVLGGVGVRFYRRRRAALNG